MCDASKQTHKKLGVGVFLAGPLVSEVLLIVAWCPHVCGLFSSGNFILWYFESLNLT